jgi:phage shock protein C
LAPRPTRQRGYADEEPEFEEVEVEMEYDERYHDYRPRKVFRYSDSGSVRLERARERLDAALRRVEDMESYVTSRRYKLDKEFSRL